MCYTTARTAKCYRKTKNMLGLCAPGLVSALFRLMAPVYSSNVKCTVISCDLELCFEHEICMLPHATNPKTWFCCNCFYHKLFFLQFAAILDFQLYLSQCFGVPVRSVGFHRRSDDPVVFFCDRNDSLRLEQVWKIIVFGTYGATSLQYPFGILYP